MSTEPVYLTYLQKQIHDIATEKGWWNTPRCDGELIALMHSELSEALEGLRSDLPDDKLPQYKMVEVELADCIIRILDAAQHRGWRVLPAMLDKMEYNKTRPWRHGKRF